MHYVYEIVHLIMFVCIIVNNNKLLFLFYCTFLLSTATWIYQWYLFVDKGPKKPCQKALSNLSIASLEIDNDFKKFFFSSKSPGVSLSSNGSASP